MKFDITRETCSVVTLDRAAHRKFGSSGDGQHHDHETTQFSPTSLFIGVRVIVRRS